MARKGCYIVKLMPRHKGSGYPTQTLKPYKARVCWNRGRAEKEAKFAMKGKMGTGVSMRNAYKYKVVKGR